MTPAKSRKPSSVDALRRGVTAPTVAPPAEVAARFEDLETRAQRPRPEKPTRIRFTLDLDPDPHQFLKNYSIWAQSNGAEVMRALLDELRDDPQLAERVKARIWQH